MQPERADRHELGGWLSGGAAQQFVARRLRTRGWLNEGGAVLAPCRRAIQRFRIDTMSRVALRRIPCRQRALNHEYTTCTVVLLNTRRRR